MTKLPASIKKAISTKVFITDRHSTCRVREGCCNDIVDELEELALKAYEAGLKKGRKEVEAKYADFHASMPFSVDDLL